VGVSPVPVPAAVRPPVVFSDVRVSDWDLAISSPSRALHATFRMERLTLGRLAGVSHVDGIWAARWRWDVGSGDGCWRERVRESGKSGWVGGV
jgi:hypothetical protein